MRRARHLLLVLLAVIGLASVSALSVSYACPQAAAAMPFMHHHHHHGQPATGNADTSFCSACTAVLPSLPLIRSHVLPPVALFRGEGAILSGIHVGLDPPPPRFE
jgi:hypothetical protein